jgi:hypothetical protein
VRVNPEKSMSQAEQIFSYLGHKFNLKDNKIMPQYIKNKQILQMCQHQMGGTRCQPKHVARLAGTLVDAAKSNARLQGLPQQIMKKAAQAVSQNQRLHWNIQKCGHLATQKPKGLQDLIWEATEAVAEPLPKVLRPSTNIQLVIKVDASQEAWSAHLNMGSNEIQTCAQTWEGRDRRLHITHQEALASAKAVEALIRQIHQVVI